MKKIVPVIMLITSALSFTLSVVGFIMLLVGLIASLTPILAITTPFIIVSLITSVFLGAFSFIFKKDILCKIAFIIDCVGALLSIASIIIWSTTL